MRFESSVAEHFQCTGSPSALGAEIGTLVLNGIGLV